MKIVVYLFPMRLSKRKKYEQLQSIQKNEHLLRASRARNNAYDAKKNASWIITLPYPPGYPSIIHFFN